MADVLCGARLPANIRCEHLATSCWEGKLPARAHQAGRAGLQWLKKKFIEAQRPEPYFALFGRTATDQMHRHTEKV